MEFKYNVTSDQDMDIIRKQIKNKKFIVLYTFDYGRANHFFMLRMSMLTCVREFGRDCLIILYTSDVQRMQELMQDFSDVVIVQFQNSKLDINFSQMWSDNRSVAFRQNGIGHSRVFIIPELLRNFDLPILYLDSDTGICYKRGNEIMEYIVTGKYPCGNMLENCIATDIYKLIGSPRKVSRYVQLEYTNINGVVCEKTKFDLNENLNINNGVMYFPSNELSKKISHNIVALYLYMHRHAYAIWDDMVSASAVLTSYSKTYNFTPISNYSPSVLVPRIADLSPIKYIIHYAYYKGDLENLRKYYDKEKDAILNYTYVHHSKYFNYDPANPTLKNSMINYDKSYVHKMYVNITPDPEEKTTKKTTEPEIETTAHDSLSNVMIRNKTKRQVIKY